MSEPKFKLRFHVQALEEWKRLDGSVREPFKKKLTERLDNPRIAASALSGMADCYKIKLLRIGHRLVYRVDGDILFVTVIAVGKRDKSQVYAAAKARLTEI